MSKELEKDSRATHIKNVKREIADIQKAIGMMVARKELIEESLKLEGEKRKIILENFGLLNPNWKYEANEDYLKLLKRQTEISWVLKDERNDFEKEQVEEQEKSQREQLASLEKELARLEEVE